MRIISQDGELDTPYELTQMWIRESCSVYQIIGNMPADEVITIATYTSKEKADKAMKMMREAYAGNIAIFQNIEPSEETIELLVKHNTSILRASLDGRAPEIRFEDNQNFYFQFPKDEEIE